MNIADRISRIQPSITLEMTAKAAELRSQGVDVINLSVGEPDFDTPDNIKEAAYSAIKNGLTKYTAGAGTPDLKNAIIEKLKRDNDLSYQPKNVIVSCGGKHSLYNACHVLFQKNDEVIIFTPYWVSFPDFVSITGATPVFVGTNPNKQYEPNFDELEKLLSQLSDDGRRAMLKHTVDELGDWMARTKVSSHLRYMVVHYLLAQSSRTMKSCLHSTSGLLHTLAVVQDRLGWDNFVEGRISKVFLEVVAGDLDKARSRLTPERWCKDFICKLLQITQKQKNQKRKLNWLSLNT